MLTYKPNIVLSNKEYKVVGTRPIRHDGAEKVTGRASYGADVRLPGMLYGKILRSPHAHARIKSIDTRHAEEILGVHAVITSADLVQPSSRVVDLAEGVIHNMRFLSNNIMAADKVLYKGHDIAAVAATSPHIAEEALKLIQVEYEVLSPVRNAEEAMRKGAPLLHERLAPLTNPRVRPGGFLNDDDPTPGSNLANHFEFRLGDIDKGFQEADVMVEQETFTSPVHQGYIEPHTGTAMWNSDGSLTIWSSSQGHFTVRDQTARLMNIPVSRVRAIPMEIGGGFGGKTLVYVEPVAAAFAMETAIDKLCEKLGMDPLAFRLLNSAKEGTRRATGPVFQRVGFVETLQAAKDHPHYAAPLEGPYRGRGVASGFWGNGTGPSSALAIVNPDGRVKLVEGSPDIGGTRASVSRQLADGLGIPIEDVNPSVGDTDSIGFTSNTGGSGVTFKTGWASYEAAQDVKRQMCARAARTWGCPVEEVEDRDGGVCHTKDADKQLTFKQIAARQ